LKLTLTAISLSKKGSVYVWFLPCSVNRREHILYMTDTTGVASFLADFYVLSRFASLEYMEYAGMLLTLYTNSVFQ
jgi:hypothetical protein